MSTSQGDLTITGTAPAGFRGQFGWALFDWANQPFFTLITTFIFAPYFTGFIVADPVLGQSYWGYTQSIAGFFIAILSPVLGSIADATGPRKPWIFSFQAVCVIACFALWWALPGTGMAPATYAVMFAVIVATIGAEFSIVFNNAMLPGLTSERRLGRLSGQAWALGYLGGLISLIFVQFAFAMPDQPLFGLDKATHEHARISGPLSALWMVVFVAPLFLFTPDQARSALSKGAAVRQGLSQLWHTLRRVRSYRNIAVFLIARMLYQDGLSAIFIFGGIYAQGIFGWTIVNLGIFGIILTVFAGIGAYLGGMLDDRRGSKRTVLLTVGGLLVGTLGILSIGLVQETEQARHYSLLFAFEVAVPKSADAGMFDSLPQQLFLLFGIIIGVCGGPVQAASRSMVARLAPPQLIGECYGLYQLSGKATAFIAPLAIGILTAAFASQRAGLIAIVVLLIAGWLLLTAVREERSALAH